MTYAPGFPPKSLLGALLLLWGTSSPAGQVVIPGAGSASLSVHVISIQERKFLATVRQQYDYSCGSAAVATLLTYQFHDPVGEAAIFKAMWNHGNQAKIQREGFSMLDMKEYLDTRGYVANGYRAGLDRLAQAHIPAIALISEKGYAHFVVIKGVGPGRVLLGDPASGTRVVTRTEFEKNWHVRILLVITNATDKAVFNSARDWQVQPRAPLGTALAPSNLVNAVLLLPGPNDF